MRRELSPRETPPREQERRGEIVPYCVAEKIRQVQPIPGRFADMPRKRRARIGPLFDDRTVTAFDPHPVRGEDPPIIGSIA